MDNLYTMLGAISFIGLVSLMTVYYLDRKKSS